MGKPHSAHPLSLGEIKKGSLNCVAHCHGLGAEYPNVPSDSTSPEVFEVTNKSSSVQMTVSSYHENGRGYGSHQAIVDLVNPNSDILDVGCASGYLMSQLEESKKCRCVGIEPNLDSAEVARSRGFTVIGQDAMSAFNTLGSSDKFDQIIFGDVLEHMVDPLTVLSMCRGLLRPSGMVIVSLPNIVGPRGRVPTTLGIWRYHESGIFDKTHLRFFSVPTGRELMIDAGFRIDKEIFVGPLTTLGGRRLRQLTALRPNLLANQMVFSACSSAA